MPVQQGLSERVTLVRADDERAAARAGGRWAGLTLTACAVVIEAILVTAFLLPLRMDRLPPSLDTNLARVYGLDLAGLTLYLAVAGGLFGAYWLAVRVAMQAPRGAVVGAVAASGVFMATLLWIHPTYSSDVLHYVATARVGFVHGENPHVVPPDAFPDDPLMSLSGWKSLPSPYGAGWSWLSAVPYEMSGGLGTTVRGVVAFKALVVLCALGTAAGVAVAAERLRAGAGVAAAVAFGWNPLVVIHLAGDGHNDAAMLLLLAWGVVALTAGRWTATLVLFVTAVLIKPAAGLALLMVAVVLLRAGRRRALLIGTGISAALAVLLYLPFWDGVTTLRPMLEEGGYFTNTPASVVRNVLAPWLGDSWAEASVAGFVRLMLFTTALLVAWTYRGGRGDLLLRIGIVYAVAVTVLNTWYQPWYVSWPLLFVCCVVAMRRVALSLVLALTAGGLLVPVATNFVAGIAGRAAEDPLIDALAVLLVLAPLGAMVAAVWRRSAAHGPEEHCPVFSPR